MPELNYSNRKSMCKQILSLWGAASWFAFFMDNKDGIVQEFVQKKKNFEFEELIWLLL